MFIHRCPDLQCAFKHFDGNEPCCIQDDHPSFQGKPGLFGNRNVVQKIREWLERNLELFEKHELDPYMQTCLGRLKPVVSGDERALKILSKLLGTDLKVINENITVPCLDGEISFPSELLAPFTDPRKVFPHYPKKTVEYFLKFIQKEEDNFLLDKSTCLLADLSTAMNFGELGRAVYFRLVTLKPDLLSDLILHGNADKVMLWGIFSEIVKISDEAVCLLTPQNIETLCARDGLGVGECQILEFIKRWSRLTRQVVDLEKCLRFEHIKHEWFNQFFVDEENLRPLLSWKKVIAWSSFLDSYVKGPLPIQIKRATRDVFIRYYFPLPQVSKKWFETRAERPDCIKLKEHAIDRRFFKAEWLTLAPFNECTSEAIEDFIAIQYNQSQKCRSFQTAVLLKSCGLTDQCEKWLKKRESKDLKSFNAISWLGIPEGFTIPPQIETSLCLYFTIFKHTFSFETLSRERFLSFVGSHKFWATPKDLWEIIECYSITAEELSPYLTPQSSQAFCDYLYNAGKLDQEVWFKLNTQRTKLREYKVLPNPNKQFTVPQVVIGTLRIALISEIGALHILELSKQTLCTVHYLEGPPCSIHYKFHRLNIIEGNSYLLPETYREFYISIGKWS